jgi:ribosomal RNA-processing protein 17
MARGKKDNSKDGKADRKSSKKQNKKEKPAKFKPYQKTEIVFDPDARRKHLQGFSARKRERRVFGLAMQKVKDRKARLEIRQSEREARIEHVELAERQKEEMMQAVFAESGMKLQEGKDFASDNDEQAIEKVETYEDRHTQSMWGGEVIVKVSTHVPGDDDSDDEKILQQQAPLVKKIDEQQQFAGKVERYMPQVKASLPGKKKHAIQHRKTKGTHGAANMKGMASHSGDFKLAQKALERASSKAAGRGNKKRKAR